MTDSKVINKIKRLLSLADGKANTNECANAWAKAQDLLMRHKLTIADISSVDDSEPIKEFDMRLYDKRIVAWKSYLANGVAKLNSCRTLTRSSYNSARHLVVGKPSDVEVVNYLVTSIISQIEFLCKEAIRSGEGKGKTFSNQFKFGAAETVLNRLTEASNKVKKEYKDSKALVLVNSRAAEVDRFMDDNYNLKKRQQYSVASNYRARFVGRRAGNKVSLSKGMKAADAKKLR